MSIKALVIIGTTIVLLAYGPAIWAQQTRMPQKKKPQTSDQINLLLHNDYLVMQESRGVAVLVDTKDQKLGELLQKQVETTLKQYRVPILTFEQVQKGPDAGYLELDVRFDRDGKTYYSRLAYSEVVGLIRKTKTLGMMMPLYDDIKSGLYSFGNTDSVKKLVDSQMERFCANFRKANQQR